MILCGALSLGGTLPLSAQTPYTGAAAPAGAPVLLPPTGAPLHGPALTAPRRPGVPISVSGAPGAGMTPPPIAAQASQSAGQGRWHDFVSKRFVTAPAPKADPMVRQASGSFPAPVPPTAMAAVPRPLAYAPPAGGPAYQWYGYGSSTPNANPLAPNGTYAQPSADWLAQSGATPGAIPRSVPESAVALMSVPTTSEPPMGLPAGLPTGLPAGATLGTSGRPLETSPLGPIPAGGLVTPVSARMPSSLAPAVVNAAATGTDARTGVAVARAQGDFRHDLVPPPPIPSVRWQANGATPGAAPPAAHRDTPAAAVVRRPGVSLSRPVPLAPGETVAAKSAGYVARAAAPDVEPATLAERVKRRVKASADPRLTGLGVSQRPDGSLLIRLRLVAGADARAFADAVSALPELAGVRVDFDVLPPK